MVKFRLLHTVVVGSRSRGALLMRPKRSKQLFSAPYVTCRCVADFLVIVIPNLIYIYIYIYIYICVCACVFLYK